MKQAFTGGYLLDGREEMQPVSGKTIYTEGTKITEISDQKPGPDYDGEIIELDGRYLMPGLINMHVHLAASGKPPKENAKPVNYKKLFGTLSHFPFVFKLYESLQDGYARSELMSGVTTLRAVGGINDLDGKTRDAIESGRIPGPRILAANRAVSVPGGHFAGSLATEAVTAADAVRDVDEIAASGADLIKLMITGGVMDCEVVGEPGILKMPPEMVKAACGEAHRLGYKVAAHTESPAGVRVALENGVDTIEHGAKPDEEIIRLFKERGAAHICTISPALPYAVFDRSVSHCTEEAQINGKVVMDGIIACAKACLAEGIPVGLGTDTGCPFITHYDMWREIWYFHKYCGVTPAFALYTATLGNAKIAGLSDVTGSVEPGKDADLLITNGNPLEDLKTLRAPRMVVARGKVYRDPRPKKMPDVDRLLDAVL